MIRSTKVTLKYTNKDKLNTIDLFLTEYLKVTQFFVDLIWNHYQIETKIPSLLPQSITSQANTWFTARAIQCAAKQASGIVRGTRRKHEKRLYVLKQLEKDGLRKRARKLAHTIKKNPLSKPNLKTIQAELDSRFVEVEFHNDTSFDGWITLSSLGAKIKLELPFKSHKKLKELQQKGTKTGGIRLNHKSATFMFEIPDVPKQQGDKVGIDIGMNRAFSCSDGNLCDDTLNGHNIESVCKIISRKKKGSKGFDRACKHRKNLIGFYKNKINWQNIKELRIEDISKLRYQKRLNRYMQSFVYRTYFESLEQAAELFGVQVTKVNPTYTSQRCSCCGWTRKKNRKGRQFKCSNCGLTMDADYNASINISLDLKPIGKKERLKRPNIKGFFWHVMEAEGQEFIVPVVPKDNFL